MLYLNLRLLLFLVDNFSDNILVAHELISALKSKKDCSEQYMTIKTDITKAYDRVEWSFLENIMYKLGFIRFVYLG